MCRLSKIKDLDAVLILFLLGVFPLSIYVGKFSSFLYAFLVVFSFVALRYFGKFYYQKDNLVRSSIILFSCSVVTFTIYTWPISTDFSGALSKVVEMHEIPWFIFVQALSLSCYTILAFAFNSQSRRGEVSDENKPAK